MLRGVVTLLSRRSEVRVIVTLWPLSSLFGMLWKSENHFNKSILAGKRG